ncbi:hypothetical protein DSM05_11025 [Pseudomonas sp. FW305-3-2-15-E-TSA4]|nr:hypothetical protein [Pseudomonas sp. FW305-3-2-15-E-TSA4]
MTDALNPKPPSAAASAAAPKSDAAPNLAQNMERLRTLAAIITDESGNVTTQAKHAAALEERRMFLDGKFKGSGTETTPIYLQISNSEFRKKIDSIRTEMMNLDLSPADEVKFVNSYSSEDQQIIFDFILSPTYGDGSRQYADLDSWKKNMEALSKVQDFMAKAKTDPAVKADPKFAEAEKLWMMADTSAPSWTALVLQLFGETPSSKLDLSDKARTVVGDVKPNAQPAPYEPGAVASKRV